MAFSLYLGSSESRKSLEQKIIIQTGTLDPQGINKRFSFNLWSQLSNSWRWPISVINSVANTSYALFYSITLGKIQCILSKC